MRVKGQCSVDGCDRAVRARGWCLRHYDLWRINGSPLIKKRAENGALAAFIALAIGHVDAENCLIWPYGKTSGRGEILIDGKMKSVPRIVCEAVRGPAPTPEHHAAHSCGNGHGGCINPHHLRWATPTENEQDKLGHHTFSIRGNWTPKLIDTEVLEIRKLHGRKSLRAIAAQFNVHHNTIWAIVHRQSWAWLKDAA